MQLPNTDDDHDTKHEARERDESLPPTQQKKKEGEEGNNGGKI